MWILISSQLRTLLSNMLSVCYIKLHTLMHTYIHIGMCTHVEFLVTIAIHVCNAETRDFAVNLSGPFCIWARGMKAVILDIRICPYIMLLYVSACDRMRSRICLCTPVYANI